MIMMEISMPYSAQPSPSATKMIDLPKFLGSSEVAPIAAGAEPPTAIPPPIHERPVDKPAEI